MEKYPGEERRQFQRTINDVEDAFERKLREHEDKEREWFLTHSEQLKADILKAFPDGLDKHREYHQKKIDAAKEEAEFWKAAKLEMTKAGVSTLVGVIKVVGVLALIGLAYKLGFGPLVSKLVGGS